MNCKKLEENFTCRNPSSYLGNSQPTGCWMLRSVLRKYYYVFFLSLRCYLGVHLWRQDADSPSLFSCLSHGMFDVSTHTGVHIAWGWSQGKRYLSGEKGCDYLLFSSYPPCWRNWHCRDIYIKCRYNSTEDMLTVGSDVARQPGHSLFFWYHSFWALMWG